jgi:DNA-binding NarL/FixJ family response regulator
MQKIKVLIADDHEIVRNGLISSLKNKKNITVIGEAANGEEALEKAEKLMPDVILMDISMPIMNGLDATEVITKKYPNIKILILTVHQEDSYVLEIVRLGAKGYILKDISPDELAKSVERVYSGEAVFDYGLSQVILDDYIKIKSNEQKNDPEKLSDREIDILKLIAKGFTGKEIADKCKLSIHTINSHREHIMKKLNIHSASGLTKYAIENGFVK